MTEGQERLRTALTMAVFMPVVFCMVLNAPTDSMFACIGAGIALGVLSGAGRSWVYARRSVAKREQRPDIYTPSDLTKALALDIVVIAFLAACFLSVSQESLRSKVPFLGTMALVSEIVDYVLTRRYLQTAPPLQPDEEWLREWAMEFARPGRVWF